MQKRDGQGETESYTESGTEEAKGGEKMTREEVVQAALTVERWCREKEGCCDDCPLLADYGYCLIAGDGWQAPDFWNLEEHLRTRGLKHD